MNKIKRVVSLNLKWLLGVFVALVILTAFLVKTSSFTAPFARTSEQNKKAGESFKQEPQAKLSAESKELAVSLKTVTPCDECAGKASFTFVVTNKLFGTASTFTIQNETAQIDAISLATPTRAVVFGSVSPTMRSINIINTETGSVIDYFHCIFPSLSKDGRFLAYVRSAPRFSAPEQWSHVYLVYDLAAPSAQNRVLRSESSDERLEDRASVGIPIYPAENLKHRVYKSSARDESQAHVLASDGLFWIQDSRLAFVDRWNKVNRLILVDLRYGADQAKSKTLPLDTTEIVDIKNCKESVNAPENLVQVTSIGSSDGKAGFVRLTFEPMGRCSRNPSLDIPIN
jgi:hypothetical protein